MIHESSNFDVRDSEAELALSDNLNYISIPIIMSTIQKGVFEIKGTGFLIHYKKYGLDGYYFVTALHCVYDKKRKEFSKVLLGFQTLNGNDERYVLDLKTNDIEKLWIANRYFDYAILPILPDSDFFNLIQNKFFLTNTLKDSKFTNQDMAILLGFGDGKSSFYKIPGEKTNMKPVWMATHGKGTIINIDQAKRTVKFKGPVIDRFSGSPILVHTMKKDIILVGIITHRDQFDAKYIIDIDKTRVTGGYGLDFNLIWKSIKRYLNDKSIEKKAAHINTEVCSLVDVKHIKHDKFKMIKID